jgi:hypothetical protein
MRKSKPLKAPGAESARLTPARAADARLDHLDHMIRAFAQSKAASPSHGLDQAYWRKRIAVLAEECDLVATQRARVMRLLDLLDFVERRTVEASQAAA